MLLIKGQDPYENILFLSRFNVKVFGIDGLGTKKFLLTGGICYIIFLIKMDEW